MPLPPDAANLQYLYRADEGTYTDLAGTTPATADAVAVALWQDRSGNGNHLGATVPPVLKLNQINGLPCIRFDGSTQFYYFSSTFISPLRTVYTVVRIPGAGVYTLTCGENYSLQWRIDGNRQRLVQAAIADIGFGTGTIPNDTWTQVNLSWDGSSGVLRRAGTVDGTLTGPTTFGATKYVGVGGQHASEFFQSDLALLMEYAALHTTAQRQDVEAWINGIWGV